MKLSCWGLHLQASSLPPALSLPYIPHGTRKMGPRRLWPLVSFLAFFLAYYVPGTVQGTDYDSEASISLP